MTINFPPPMQDPDVAATWQAATVQAFCRGFTPPEWIDQPDAVTIKPGDHIPSKLRIEAQERGFAVKDIRFRVWDIG